jgi:multidrug resistance efflux pump
MSEQSPLQPQSAKKENIFLRFEHVIAKNKRVATITLTALLIIVIGGGAYWYVVSQRVYIENATVSAPLIPLSSSTGGVLKELYVHEGEIIPAHLQVARVGDDVIYSETDGVVATAPQNIGKLYERGEAVVTMTHLPDLRIVGRVDEDKGLANIRAGQKAIFTVDTFGSKEYSGTVDQVSPVARSSNIVFNISDQREEQQFEIKIKYNVSAYPELKNGMSARLWVYQH